MEVQLRTAKWILLAAAVNAASALVAAPPQPSFSKDVQPIFNKGCVDCHGVKKAKAKLDLSEGAALKNLVNVPSEQVPGTLRVKPGDPEESYLWLKLDHRAKEGAGMPKGLFGASKLPQEELDLVRAWIEGGANP